MIMTDIRETNIKLVQCFLDALNRWDLDTIGSITTEDVVLEVPFRPDGFERRTEGKARYLELLKQASTIMVDGSENLHDIEIDTFGSNPDKLVAQYKSAMKLHSGVDYSNEYVSLFSIRNGRICKFIEHLDSIKLFSALGGTLQSADPNGRDSVLPPLLSEVKSQ